MNNEFFFLTGYTVELEKDFAKFNDIEEKNPKLSVFEFYSDLKLKKGRVVLIIDNKNKEYIRLLYVLNVKEVTEQTNEVVNEENIVQDAKVPERTYDELNKWFKIMFNKDLNKEDVKLKSWKYYLYS